MPNLTVPPNVRRVASQLAQPRPMRRGSVSERYVKCNKAGCPCGARAEARHGPYYSVARVVRGRTHSRWLDADQAGVVRQQVEAGQAFRRHVETFWEACEQWADAQLDAPEAVSLEAAKKGPSQRRSKPRSSAKSTRSSAQTRSTTGATGLRRPPS